MISPEGLEYEPHIADWPSVTYGYGNRCCATLFNPIGPVIITSPAGVAYLNLRPEPSIMPLFGPVTMIWSGLGSLS